MADVSSLVVVAPYSLRDFGDRPRRYLDPTPVPAGAQALVGAWFANDEQLELQYHRRQCGPVRRTLAAMRLIFRGYSILRRARVIYCLDGSHYALLLLLAQNGWLRTEGKVIRRTVFHDRGWQNLASRLRSAPPAFQVECITQEQFASAASHLGACRVVYRSWKVDTEWFQPRPDVLHLRALLPGNASRDESLVPPLLHRGISITRVGRLESLPRRYAVEIADPRFELVTNASHREYLGHLHAAPAVLLPIVPCDGSAGLTAAMEAIAAGVPVLANRSMGLTELFAACRYPVPMVEGLAPDAWAQAYHQLKRQAESGEFNQALEVSRKLLCQQHSILPGTEDWSRVLLEACAQQEAETIPTTPGTYPSAQPSLF